MPIDPPFDDGRWPNPWPPQNGLAGGTPYPDWTDPFVNLRGLAPYPFASAPAPFTAAQLGAMAWHPPIFSDDWPSPALPAARTPTLGLSVPPGWPDPLQSTSSLAQSNSPSPPGAIDNLTALQNPFALGGPTLDLSGGPPVGSAYTPPGAAPPTRSVLFDHASAPWDLGAPDRDLANLGQSGQTLGLSDLPLSKSGTPFIPPPPQFSITPEQWLSVAHLLSPNLVDYFTKTPPPAPPFPAIPGKIPSDDNPYATGAALEAATWLLPAPELGIVGPLLGAVRLAENSAAEATLRTAAERLSTLSTLERLLAHVDSAVVRVERDGLTQGQINSLFHSPYLEPAHKGERIDTFAKETVAKDENLRHLIITPRFQFGPDSYDPINQVWYDITTRGQWVGHAKKYTAEFGQGTPLFYGDK